MTLKHPYKTKLSESFLKRILSTGYGDLLSVHPQRGDSYQDLLVPFKQGTFSQLEKLDLMCTNGNGKNFPLSLICKRYSDIKKKEVRDEIRLFNFYNRVFGGTSPFPRLFDYLIGDRALLREYLEGITLENALYKFDNMKDERKNTMRNSSDPAKRKKVQNECDRLSRNKESLKNATLNLVATIHHYGTGSIVDLSKSGGIQKYKIAKPDTTYYANDCITHFENILNKLDAQRKLNQDKISEFKKTLYNAFFDSPIAQYIEKAKNTLILGDCHLSNFIVYEYLNGEKDNNIYLESEFQINNETLLKRIKFVDLGKARVGAATSDLADLLIYPEFSDSVWNTRAYARTYIDKIGGLQGRVIPSGESFGFERGVHYFAIVRSLHAADVHPDHQDKNLQRLREELDDDSELNKLKESLKPLFDLIPQNL